MRRCHKIGRSFREVVAVGLRGTQEMGLGDLLWTKGLWTEGLCGGKRSATVPPREAGE